MQTMTFPSDAIEWPPLCACCLAAPSGQLVHTYTQTENYIVVKKTSSIGVEVPYCDECMHHVTWYEQTPVWAKAIVVFMVSWLVGAFFWLGLFVSYSFAPPMMFATPFIATGLYLWLKLRKRPRRLGKEHAARGGAVHGGYFSDSELRLAFVNDSFAQAVRELNDVS